MEKLDVFYCATDEHSFEELQYAVEFVGEQATSLKDALGWVIEIHEKDQPNHGRFINGQNIIESMESSAYDNFSEHSDGYLIDLIYNTEKCKELEKIISDWMDKNAQQPSFYQSKKQVGAIVVDQKLLDKFNVVIED